MKRCIFITIVGIFMLSLVSCSYTARKAPQEQSDMITIPEGKFMMGLNSGELNERPEHDVFVDTFMIDRYEVSAKEFAAFLNERDNPDNQYFFHDGYSTVIGISYMKGEAVETRENPESYIPRKGFENFPANNVSWFGAYAYCQSKGKRLPTEAEWEKASRGKDGRIYPWGDSMPDDSKARYNQKLKEKGLNVMVAVDALPDGVSYYKVFNMAGNVWEWVDDWFRQNYCQYCQKGKPCVPCQERGPCNNCPEETPASGDFKVLRGGSWYDSFGTMVIRTTYRYWLDPADRFLNTGFRCAK
jgi:formylglycine-generating enzyme required for sulfatase activity